MFNSKQVTCWFCHQHTQLPEGGTKQNWYCSFCMNKNQTDNEGHQVDSRPEMYKETPVAKRTSQVDDAPPVFCSTCQRNQTLVCQILANYLPDEEDPEYSTRLKNIQAFDQSLRRRYPLVCRSCQVKVDKELQEQAQWMYRRELAWALKRSKTTKQEDVLQPTLRRKRMVLGWFASGIVAVGCHLVMWDWYWKICIRDTDIRWPLAIVSTVTYLSRRFNPLWLYMAMYPGHRCSGMQLYQRRMKRLALARLLALLLSVYGGAAEWIVVIALYDVLVFSMALGSLRIRSSIRQQTKSKGKEKEEERQPNTNPAYNAQQTLNSLESLSFGASPVNADQDDNLHGLDGLLKMSHESRNSSGDEGTVDTDIMDDLGDLMAVDHKPSVSTTSIKTEPESGGFRAFESNRFMRTLSTGLEHRMSSFTLDDPSTGIPTKKLLAGILIGLVLAEWSMAPWLPWYYSWIVRLVLVVGMVQSPTATSLALSAALVISPLVFVITEKEWQRWPSATKYPLALVMRRRRPLDFRQLETNAICDWLLEASSILAYLIKEEL